jgi:hypothetical protein
MRGLIFWSLYFAPTLIAWFRVRQGKPLVNTLRQNFFFNFLLGWTVVGWLLVLANAFGLNPVAWLAPRLVKVLPTGPAGNTSPGAPSSSQTTGAPCSQCQGSGSLTCSSCAGRGSWYDPPQGEQGTAQLRTCPACVSSGRLRCTYCGGSGRAAAML